MWVDDNEDEYEPEDDELPWADPQIRLNYEAALGRFILAFNAVDYYLSALTAREYSDRNVVHLSAGLWEKPFSQRLDLLEALASTARLDGIKLLSFTELREISAHRNKLAHGHFEQNPFDGTYAVLARRKARDYPVDKIDAMTERLGQIAYSFRSAYYAAEFSLISAQL